jgi:hypothetical protein
MVYTRSRLYGLHPLPRWSLLHPVTIATLLETYTLSEIIELNDLTDEEVLEYLVGHRIVKLPEIRPLDYE